MLSAGESGERLEAMKATLADLPCEAEGIAAEKSPRIPTIAEASRT